MTPPDPAASITQLQGRLQWYVSCTRRLAQLPDTETEDEPTQGYVRCGDLAWEVCDDLKAAIAALEAAQLCESQARAALQELLDAGDFTVSSTDDVASMLRLGTATDKARELLAAGVPQEPPA